MGKKKESEARRESLREKGQFWTPSWITEAMVRYVLSDGADHIFDPAVGTGAFFRAAKDFSVDECRTVKLFGTEIDPSTLHRAEAHDLKKSDLTNVQVTDFLLDPPKRTYKAVVANPPYIRHHRLSAKTKTELKTIAKEILGKPLDGRAGIHVYFLIRALQLLDKNGRLSFIMPADTCEGVFAKELWEWITNEYCLDLVITFSPKASPFPDQDTNPLIFMIKKSKPKKHFLWAECAKARTKELKELVVPDRVKVPFKDIITYQRSLEEGLSTGLSRPPLKSELTGFVLGDFARVLRGIATGANDFFFLTKKQAKEIGIPERFLKTAIGRTRDVKNGEITAETLKNLEDEGRPTLLLSLDGTPMEELPKKVSAYLEEGEKEGLPQRKLISMRSPWYKMEKREVPPILFAYLGRRNVRFIRNLAGVVPLTGFLCVYPIKESKRFIDGLWKILCHPKVLGNLRLVGKSYGKGALKVEPRALERLPLPTSLVSKEGLKD